MSTTMYERLANQLSPILWEPEGRAPLLDHQRPPPGRWHFWVLRGGRGSGKTEAGARYFAGQMRRKPRLRGRIIGPTLGDVFESCIDGPSGLRAIDPEVKVLPSAPGGAKVVWPNGSEALLVGTPTPRDVDRLRASGNRHIDWWEEAAANPQLAPALEQAEFGLRLGDHPHSIATTTPRNTKAFRELLKTAGVVVTHGTIDDNPYLNDEVRARLRDRYAGTRIGRQELGGELLIDVPGALWNWEMLNVALAGYDPDEEYSRVVVAIDPAVTSGEEADEVGIVVAGKRYDGGADVIADKSCQGMSPNGWAKRAVAAFDHYGADRIIGEVNNGGELVESVIRQVRADVPYKAVRASRGKVARAEPIAAQFEQGRWHIAKGLDELIVQLTEWTPDSGESPGRLDAMVWAGHELAVGGGRGWRVV